METLQQHINREHGCSPLAYSKTKGYAKQQVNTMLRHGGYWMHDNKLFILRRDFDNNEK